MTDHRNGVNPVAGGQAKDTTATCVACGGDAGVMAEDATPAANVIHVGCMIDEVIAEALDGES